MRNVAEYTPFPTIDQQFKPDGDNTKRLAAVVSRECRV